MNQIELLATGCGIGRALHAPGTIASLVAAAIAIPVLLITGWIGMTVVAVAATGLGVWAAEQYSQQTGIADPKECVIDEFAGQWIACAIVAMDGAPDGAASFVVRLLLAFLLFRLFDIAKPGPVAKAEQLPGGLGIMADDVLAGAIAGFIVYLIAYSGFI